MEKEEGNMGVFKEREFGFVAEIAVWIFGQGCTYLGRAVETCLILGV